jgi:hypothetical protein
MFVLDTNVISELRQGKPNPSMAVRQWAAGQPSNQLFLSAITLLELELGFCGPHFAVCRKHRTRVCGAAHPQPALRPGRDDCGLSP